MYNISTGAILQTQMRENKMEREVNFGTKRFTRVVSNHEQGDGGAYHHYAVESTQVPTAIYAQVDFQSGPVKEKGVNGCHQEDLLIIVMDRLECFQKGAFRCKENAMVLTKIQEALQWLNARTNKRQQQGIEGTSVNHEEE